MNIIQAKSLVSKISYCGTYNLRNEGQVFEIMIDDNGDCSYIANDGYGANTELDTWEIIPNQEEEVWLDQDFLQ